MARHSEFYARVGDGVNARSVGYSSTVRDGYFGVRFVTPEGKRVEKMTGIKASGKTKGKPTPGPDFEVEAARIIARAYATTHPTVTRKTWDEALAEVKLYCEDRPDTRRAMETAVELFRELVPHVAGPADVTEAVANRFGLLVLATPYRRGRSTVERKREPSTLDYYRRSMSALWKRLRQLDIAQGNPWSGVEVPEQDEKEIYVPTKEETAKFFAYIHERYPHWERLHALLQLKLVSASRTKDICQLKTAQVKERRFVFGAKQVKTKAERAVYVPKALHDTLHRIGGKVWLWDGWNDDLKKYRLGRNPIPDSFQASTVQGVVENVFREYSDSHPDVPRLSPHDLRRRAITSAVEVTGSVDAAAALLGVSVQTIRNNYLDPKQAFNLKDGYEKLAAELLPLAHTIPTLSGDNGEQAGTPGNK